MSKTLKRPGNLRTAVVACAYAFAMTASAQPEGTKPAALPPEIKTFIAAKEKHARSLATNLNSELPAEVVDFYQAALGGNWPQTSNTYAGVSRRLDKSPEEASAAVLHAVRHTMWETRVALEYYTQAQPKYATAFGRDIIASIPAGSIYFGGTDPGRGLVTALCKSHAEADPFFTITQNNLADGTYLNYLRQTYRQRIYLPADEDSQAAFQKYLSDAERRLKHDREFPGEPKQIKSGEDIKMVDGRVQVSGQVAVMSINALLVKVIFDKNPRLGFYVEEGFPLDWMYPHLEPHGLIMKLNREPQELFSPEAIKRDQEFWSAYLKPMLGDWLREDTAVSEVCDFAERVFVRKDLKGFAGDAAYVSDAYAGKAFARLRASIAGVYRWRAVNANDEAERKRMKRTADLAFRQALALCPYSRETVSRYVRALAEDGRMDDARRVAGVAAKFPETKSQAAKLIGELELKK